MKYNIPGMKYNISKKVTLSILASIALAYNCQSLPSELNHAGREAQIARDSAKLGQMIEGERQEAQKYLENKSNRSQDNLSYSGANNSNSNSGSTNETFVFLMFLDIGLMTLVVFSLIPYTIYFVSRGTNSSSHS